MVRSPSSSCVSIAAVESVVALGAVVVVVVVVVVAAPAAAVVVASAAHPERLGGPPDLPQLPPKDG